MRNKKKTFLSLALAVAIGLSAGAGIITQKSSADDNLESFAQAQTATETITPKQYENFKQVNETSARTPTNSFKSAETVPTLGKDVSLHLKINIPVRCNLNIYAKYVSDDNSTDEIYGSLYNANGVKQDTHNVLEPGLYYYSAGALSSYEENPVWKVYAYYLPVGEELTEAGQKYIAYGDGDRLNKILPWNTVGKITYSPGSATYKFVTKVPGCVYLELFNEDTKGILSRLEDAKFTLYNSKMKVIDKVGRSCSDERKFASGSLSIDHFYQGVTFNASKKGTYYLKMTGYTGSFAYHMRFLKGLSCKIVSPYYMPALYTATPTQLVNKYLKDKSAVYAEGSNNLYINEPPLEGINVTNLGKSEKCTNIVKWKKVKTAQKYLIRRFYYKNNKTVELKKKYTKNPYYKVTKKDMGGHDAIEVHFHPVRYKKIKEIGPGGHTRNDVIIVYKNGKFLIHSMHGN